MAVRTITVYKVSYSDRILALTQPENFALDGNCYMKEALEFLTKLCAEDFEHTKRTSQQYRGREHLHFTDLITSLTYKHVVFYEKEQDDTTE